MKITAARRKALPAAWLILTLLAAAALTVMGPAEKSLGVNVRVVYLHGAWVWAALASILGAALAGLGGLLTGRERLHRWSSALGRTGLIFWITYLPISMWAMQANWNGLFLAEPRWRLAVVFALGGVILQAGLSLVQEPAWASAGNLAYLAALALALYNSEEVMHPSSPIFSSESIHIRLFFSALLMLLLLAAWQVARLMYRLEAKVSSPTTS